MFSQIPIILTTTSQPSTTCATQQFPSPKIFGAEILSIESNLVVNYSKYIPAYYYQNHDAVNVTNANFCNVTIEYTHPGEDDRVNVEVFLPVDSWNGRMQGIGGGGWAAGFGYEASEMSMIAAVGEGYVAVTTDGGHPASADLVDWALLSPGNINLYSLQDFGSVSLNDSAAIAKDLSQSFYGKAPNYSYFSGCSQGGRQGMMLAQRYPHAYDGIAAAAPAIYLDRFLATAYWPQFVMNQLGEYPRACELDAITAGAISACDALDGVVDEIILDPTSCEFDPFTMVNTIINCTDTGLNINISMAAAIVVNAIWEGPRKADGSFMWYGLEKGAQLRGIASTTCSSNGTCTGAPVSIANDFIGILSQKDESFNVADMTHEDFDRVIHQSIQQYSSIIGTDDPDLSSFRNAGGKILTYHGLADTVIPPKGTEKYYNAVAAEDPNIHDFYRLFQSPGLGHCFMGAGGRPGGIFDAMVDWVELGKAPKSLNSTSLGDVGPINYRLLCPYPEQAHYDGEGGTNSPNSYYCDL